MDLQDYLPAAFRGPGTHITAIAAGLSGAGVYRVEHASQTFVLKVADGGPDNDWHRTLQIQQLAAAAHLAPTIVYIDKAHRAVLSEFIADHSFPALYGNPATRHDAISLLGQTLRRVHKIPLPEGSEKKNARAYVASTWAGLKGTFVMPGFATAFVDNLVNSGDQSSIKAPVLSHNDVNPSNLIFDGERLLLLDWETSGANDPYYDLATASIFLRMDADSCLRLLSAYEGVEITEIPPDLIYNRRIVAALSGTVFMRLASQGGHAGATGHETLESTLSLGDFYQKMRAGQLSPATAEGQWHFGLALIKEAATSLGD